MTTQPTSLHDKIIRWSSEAGATHTYQETLDLLTLLKDELFAHYQPFPERQHFFDRLQSFIESTPSKRDQQLLFNFVPWLLFVGPREMDALFRGAFTGPISRWLIEQSGLQLNDSAFDASFSTVLEQTWFGSLAGMDIGSFCRVNGITGQSYRCDFRSLGTLGAVRAVRRYMTKKPFTRIVAVEDYVGSGAQMEEACSFLLRLRPTRILVCPIIVAPDGDQRGRLIETTNSQISYRPLFVVPPSACLPKTPRGSEEPQLIRRMRRLVNKLWTQVEGTKSTQPLYGPFGFGNFGSLVLTYLNCPDNVPPIVHHQSDTWTPLFPRSSREA